MADVLLTISGDVPQDLVAQIQAGRRPRVDYIEMSRTFGADRIDFAAARRLGGQVGRALGRAGGPALMLAWACFAQRRRYRVIVTDSEQVGIPLALLLRTLPAGARPRHVMITHILSAKKKLPFLDVLRAQGGVDTFLVYSTWQQRFIQQHWDIPAERVVFTPFMVDSAFFAPERVTASREAPMICTAGLERRDYATLMRAVDGLAAQVVIAAASPWSRQKDATEGAALPANVKVQRFSQFDLRQLYADSRFVVMPLENVEFQAGVTAILEAMAMGRAVICTRTPGQTDVVVEGETGLYVPPGDPQALRAAIERLLANPGLADEMGRAGRRRVEQQMSLDRYAVRLGAIVRAAAGGPPAPLRSYVSREGER